MNKRHAAMSALMAVLLLSGCSNVNELLGNEESVDYKSAAPRRDPLSIPPDLTQAASDPRYRAPPTGTTTYSQFQQEGQNAQARGDQPTQSDVVPARSDMHIERDGNARWLVINRPAEQVFPKLVDFWNDNGLTVRTNNPQEGLIETDWAENRAKIPESWLRSALGKFLDNVYDSGERERFRTRVERVGDHTEVFVSHEHMIQKRTNSAINDNVTWEYAPEDQGLNAAMLARMMVALGTNIDTAKRLLATAQNDKKASIVQGVATDGAALRVDEPFDRAWRRIGIALDAGGFTVDDRDRSKGEYFIRYVDSDNGMQNEQPGFFSKLFGKDKRTEAPKFQLKLADQGSQTVVTVLDANGQRDTTPTAQRLLGVLRDKM